MNYIRLILFLLLTVAGVQVWGFGLISPEIYSYDADRHTVISEILESEPQLLHYDSGHKHSGYAGILGTSSSGEKRQARFLFASLGNFIVTKGPDFYCGAKSGSSPDLTPRPNEFKVDKATGTVKPTHGISVFDNPSSVSSKGLVPHKVDQSTIPDTLQIIQRGKDPRHFEITPKPGANLTPQQFIDACSKIGCSN